MSLNQVNSGNLKAIGRVQFFYHSPRSQYPIRDVTNVQGKGYKTEPHIEIGAENYWYPCYQCNNIRPFIRNEEKYLFLMTTCKFPLFPQFGKKLIVGYIVKQFWGISPLSQKSTCSRSTKKKNYFVKGDLFLYKFKDAIPISNLGFSNNSRMHLVNLSTTRRILSHFKTRKNVKLKCIAEIRRIDKNNETCLRLTKSYYCPLKSGCLR